STAFSFGVSPRGVKQDSYQYDDTREDMSWDAVWDAATSVDSLGWTAEFRIPYSQLRFSPRVAGDRVWGISFMRDLARRDERSTWSPWTRNSPGFVSFFGELSGLDAVRAPTRLEVVPYASSRLQRAPGDPNDPFYRRNDARGSVGADFRYGLPGGFTLTGTVNPDFGQVEVDPAVVNLTAFETSFPERRPFFVEGSDLFRFGQLRAQNYFNSAQAVYSRRIGRPPQGRIVGNDISYVDVPDQSTILGAAKVSGKTSNGWSVGMLDALTAQERAGIASSTGVSGSVPVEPLANYFVGRVRKEMNQGRTVASALVTATNRSLSDSVFLPVFRSQAYVVGVDGLQSWHGRAWTLSGYFAQSLIYGSESVIAATQRSSARYFQRPDARTNRYDPTRTSMNGQLAGIALSHGGKWDGSVALQEISPSFESNDLGFQTGADRRFLATYLGRYISGGKGIFRDRSYGVLSNNSWNFDGNHVYSDFSVTAGGTFKNFWNVGVNAGWNPDFTSDRLTRGGPVAQVPAGWRVGGNFSSDRRKRVAWNSSFSYVRDRVGEFVTTVSSGLQLRPSRTLDVSIAPRYSHTLNTSQFVLARADALATATFGRRYVFADVDQTTVSIDTRVNWSFTRNLSLQVYAQPFVAAGDFANYKEFARPGTYDFLVYGRDAGTIAPASSGGFTVDPDGAGPAQPFVVGNRSGTNDFTLRSLRGNAVLRWEYRPGSTLFFVWQQLRGAQYDRGELETWKDLSGVFSEPAQNVFMIKVTYWLDR
ncbi:MAG: hypothetical protein JO306_06380, partial [Gemmatimonadetes bacterium]|nr:hypothetical protein [Gemmatimonadota bacterium]